MNHFIILLVSIGFGALGWGMCAVSDWLFGDKPKRKQFRPVSAPVAAATKQRKERIGRVLRSHR